MGEPVTIIGGTGALGHGLAKAGVAVTIGSRDAGRAVEAARRVRERVTGRLEHARITESITAQ